MKTKQITRVNLTKSELLKRESSFVSIAFAIEKVWSGESRRIDLPYSILGTDVTVRIYQTIPGLLRVDIRVDKPENSRVKRGALPE